MMQRSRTAKKQVLFGAHGPQQSLSQSLPDVRSSHASRLLLCPRPDMSASDKDQNYINLLRKLQRTRETNLPVGRDVLGYSSPSVSHDPGPGDTFSSGPSLVNYQSLLSYPPASNASVITEDKSLPPLEPREATVNSSNFPESPPTPSVPMETSNGYPYSPDFENAVIAKQRRELHLLVDELRERDKELNEMVASHQRQIAGWEADRRMVLQQEEKLRTMEAILHDRQSQITNLTAKVEAAEQALREKHSQVMDLQGRTDSLTREVSKQKEINNQIQSVQRSTDQKTEELSGIIRSLEAREVTLKDALTQKESQLSQSRRDAQDAGGRGQALEEELGRANQANASLKSQLRDANNQNAELRKDLERCKAEVNRRHGEIREFHQRLERKEHEMMQVKKDLQLAGEREKRKDELLQSQKLKIERGDSELAHLRQLYERMQKDLSTLHSNLETSKEMLLAESSNLSRHKHVDYGVTSPSPLFM